MNATVAGCLFTNKFHHERIKFFVIEWMLCFLPALVVEETVVKLSQAMTLFSMVGYNGGADGAFLYGLGGLQQVSFSSKIKKILILILHQASDK